MIHTISLPKQLFLFLLLILLANIRYNLYANDLQFIPLNSSSLPTNEVRNLYQDNDGYIWISTYNGLLRFDGYSNIVYRPNGIDPTHNIKRLCKHCIRRQQPQAMDRYKQRLVRT